MDFKESPLCKPPFFGGNGILSFNPFLTTLNQKIKALVYGLFSFKVSIFRRELKSNIKTATIQTF